MASEIKEDNSQPEVKKDENVIETPEDIDNSSKDKKDIISDQTQEKAPLQEKEKPEDEEEKPEDQEEKPKDKIEAPEGGKDQPKVKKEQPKVKEESKGRKEQPKGKKEQPKEKKEQPKEKKEQPKEKKEQLKDKKEEPKEKEQPKEKSESEDDSEDEEEEVGLLDRPVEVSGCRARKKVERLEMSFSSPKEKQELPEGKGKKLGECLRIEAQIQKIKVQELKQLHKILFNRVGSGNEIKKNIRKFSGFPFDETSIEFSRKKASVEKLTISVLKQACSILDIERSGTKDDIVSRIMAFLLNPEDSGKKVPTKKKTSTDKLTKEKKKSSGKKVKSEKKDKDEIIEEDADENMDNDDKDDSGDDESMGGSDEENEDAVIDEEPKTKSKVSKAKPKAEKKKKNEKPKAVKRKLDSAEDSENEKQTKKANKMPSDDEISKLVKDILEAADLQEITMKKVIKQVSDAYPDFDLSHKKAFIKSTIKSVIS